jgi:hypothetical protein
VRLLKLRRGDALAPDDFAVSAVKGEDTEFALRFVDGG